MQLHSLSAKQWYVACFKCFMYVKGEKLFHARAANEPTTCSLLGGAQYKCKKPVYC